MLLSGCLAGLLCCAPPIDQAFTDHFTGRAMRLDFFHTGGRGHEVVAVDRVRLEGDWPGSRTQLLDPLNLGKYWFEVVARDSNSVLYARGFASVYGEWETTGAANSEQRTFHESLRFPEPKQPVQVNLKKRASDQRFVEIFTTVIDPADRTIDRSPPSIVGSVIPIVEHGPIEAKDDLLIIGDGYAENERDRLVGDARRLVDVLFATQPFARRANDFNVRVLFLPARESGVSRPSDGVWRSSPLGTSYDAFQVERSALTFDNRALREAAALAPCDHLEILMNERKYGGGGLFNAYATCAASSSSAPYLFVHEFGHHFAALADEYYSSPVAYEESLVPGQEPWEPNVTMLNDPATLKWKDLVAAGVSLPTPWHKKEFDDWSREFTAERMQMRKRAVSEDEMEAFLANGLMTSKAMLGAEPHATHVGAFEGANYQARGLYRSSVDCIMFTRNMDAGFCPVCARAIERIISLYAR